ncbi:MAG: cobalamin-dependent protein, partial [Elusimicrobiota bacterium]
MKILLTNAPLQYHHRQAFVFRDWGTYNLALLATLAGKDHQVKILDNWHYILKSHAIFETIADFKPDLVGINHNAEVDSEHVMAIAKEIKRRWPHIIMITGGQSATVHAEEMLDNGFDCVVRGEAEVTFPELLKAIEGGRRDWSAIKGLIYKDGPQVCKTDERPMLTDLSVSPFPDIKYMPKHDSWYWPGEKSSVIETSRGCPFICDFCMVTSYWKRSYRKRPNKEIIDYLGRLVHDHGTRHLYFIDDSFGLRANEYMELCQMIVDAKLKLKWFSNGFRA